MLRDEAIAREVRAGLAPATLRTYRWNQPAVSLGRRQRLEDLPQDLLAKGLPIVHRPTGGGAVLHHADEFTYALALPRSAFHNRLRLTELPVHVHRELKEQLQARGILPVDALEFVERDSGPPSTLCFEAPVRGDLLYRGRKVAGSALRVWRDGLLIQGSIQKLPVAREVLLDSLGAVIRRLLSARTQTPVGAHEC